MTAALQMRPQLFECVCVVALRARGFGKKRNIGGHVEVSRAAVCY